MTLLSHDLVADVTLDDGLHVNLNDSRAEASVLFHDLGEADRRLLAADAWRIGLRALGNAHSQARESRFEDIGKALVGDVERELRAHFDRQFETMEHSFKRYFDPSEGEVAQRMTAFLADEGVLHRLLRDQIGGDRSVLAQTLARHVGENSELFRRLSPSDKHGVVQVLEERVRAVLEQNQQALLVALDPLAEHGAVAKLLRTLRKDLEDAQAQGGRQLQKAVAALDANDETSAISRLMRETQAAQRQLVAALNPDDASSPIAAVGKTVKALLEAHGQSQIQLLERQQERQKELEVYIRETIAKLEARKAADAKSPRGGIKFEEAVLAFIGQTCGEAYLVEGIGETTGRIAKCRRGDILIAFGQESAFAGCRVVVEAKHAMGYTAAKVLEEMEIARNNRDASVGLFVLSSAHAWPGAPEFIRYGSTILVQWDADDPSTDVNLKAAVVASLFMATRRRDAVDPGDIKAMRDVEKRIHDELKRLRRMRDHNEKISSSSEDLRDELRKGERKLALLLDAAKATLTALDVELVDEDAEVASPIELPAVPTQRSLPTPEVTPREPIPPAPHSARASPADQAARS